MKIHKYNNMCWWCGAKADSREHKYKKSELVQECGAGLYKGQRALIRITPNKDHKIQGPGSNQVKYKKNIYHNCNNAKSQDFDIAYETFITLESVYLPIVEEIGTYNILFQNKNTQPCN